MPPLPLEIPPGIVRVDSPNAAKGRYTDGDKVRFVKGFPEKWKGWQTWIADTLVGIARGALSWTNQYGNTNVSFGTHLKLYAVTGNDTLSDITPIRASSTINADPFATTDGSAVVTVTDTAHGADDLAFVTYSGAAAVAGITIVGEYQLTKIDANSYTITHSSNANATTTGGGAAVVAAYQINPGLASGTVGLGWGAGTWNTGTWDTPRTEGITLELRTWSLSEYGNDLFASPFLGGLYLWEEATDTEAEVVSGAPTSIRAMFVTPERFVFALGTSTPMTVDWPDQDDITDWTPSAANTANTRTLQSGSKLMGGTALSDGISLVWSDTSLYLFQYTGTDFVYDSRLVGTSCGLIGQKAHATVSGLGFWMSGRDFHIYAGGVSAIPNSDDVRDFVFADMDPDQVSKLWCEHDEPNNQVRWHYVSLDSPDTEPDKYVDVSIGDWVWTTGTWSGTGETSRTTATHFRPGGTTSLMVDADGTIFEHNVGVDNDGAALESFITYGLYAIARGEQNVDLMGIVPDCQRQTGDLDFEVYTKERPNSAANFDSGTSTLSEGDEIADIRLSGRHFGMTVRSNAIGGDYRLGIVALEVQGAGMRR